jgi:V/A-type H+/Na+-transporting ATPase subunit D
MAAKALPAPTKTNLMNMKEQLSFARQGYQLLDQKRSILVLELLTLVDQAVDFEERTHLVLAEAYESLRRAVLDMGKLRTAGLVSAVNISSSITISSRRVMGVSLPVVKTEFSGDPPYFSPDGTSPWIDRCIDSFGEALKLMGHLAELKISILRLSQEVRKTIRKVNALEKIAIPDLEEAVRFIRNRLEEDERDSYILMKRVKAQLEKRQAQRGREAAEKRSISPKEE